MSGYPRPISTVLVARTSALLTSVSDVKTELDLTSDAPTAVLTRLVKSCSAAVENYCNRTFAIETVQDAFYPQRDNWPRAAVGGADPLQLSRWPITDIVSVVENGTTLTEGADFVRDAVNGQLIRLDSNGWPRRWAAWPLTIQYKAGFSPIPADVQEACIRTVSQRYFARGRDPMLRGEKIPGVAEFQYWVATGDNASAENNLSPDVQSLLDNFRQPVIA